MFERVVLTASNTSQAGAYRSELRARGLDASSTPRVTVIPDPGGRRVGSGISTLLTLAELGAAICADGKAGETLEELFTGARLCIIHAGGDSRRLPAYAAHGKIFAPLPLERRTPYPPALFDLIFEDLSQLELPEQGRAIIATGDVFLALGAHGLRLDRPGVVGVAWPDTPERGSKHGVYLADDDGTVTGFLHKPSPEQARALGAVRPDGTVLIDTGIVCLDPKTIAHWLSEVGVTIEHLRSQASHTERIATPDNTSELSGRFGQGLLQRALDTGSPAIDLYGDILPALAPHETTHHIDWCPPRPKKHYPESDPLRLDHSVATLPTSPFLHIGSSREMLDALTPSHAASSSIRHSTEGRSGSCVYNSILESQPLTLGSRVIIESCHLSQAPTLPGSNMLVGVPRELDQPIVLPEGWGLVCLPVRDGFVDAQKPWVALCFGVDDDLKTPFSAGGTLGNRPLAHLLDTAMLSQADLWTDTPDEDCSLWTAQLWTPTGVRTLLDPIGWMLGGDLPTTAWRASPRYSAAEVMAMVDHTRLLAARDRVWRHV